MERVLAERQLGNMVHGVGSWYAVLGQLRGSDVVEIPRLVMSLCHRTEYHSKQVNTIVESN